MPANPLRAAVLLALVIILLAACGEAEEFDAPVGNFSPTNTPQPTPMQIQSYEEILETQATHYAGEHNVTSDEAIRRFKLIDEFGPLGAMLEEHETATFAMAAVEHKPELTFVLYFTDNGENTLRKYVDPDSELFEAIEIREAQYSVGDLRTMYDETRAIFDQLGFQMGGSTGDVLTNSITIYVNNSEQVYQMLEDAELELPERVTLAGDGPPVSFDVPEEVPGIYIAIRKPSLGPLDWDDAELTGTLVLEGGCLLIQPSYGGGLLLPFWHADHRLQVDGDVVEVINGDGTIIARVGHPVYVGGSGGESRTIYDDHLHYPVPDTCPADGSWSVGGIDPLDQQPVIPTPVPEGTPFDLHTVEWPAEFAGVQSIVDALPAQLGDDMQRWEESESMGRLSVGYGPQDAPGAPKLVITDLTTGVYFPDYWTSNDLMASQFMGASGLALGVLGDVTWASEDTNNSGRIDRYDSVPVHAINWGTSDGRVLFTASAADYEQLVMLVSAVVGAVE